MANLLPSPPLPLLPLTSPLGEPRTEAEEEEAEEEKEEEEEEGKEEQGGETLKKMVTDGPTNRRMDGPTNGQSVL